MSAQPCPFCGSAEALVEMVEGSSHGPDHYWYCAACSACGPRADSAASALALWSDRRPAPRVEA